MRLVLLFIATTLLFSVLTPIVQAAIPVSPWLVDELPSISKLYDLSSTNIDNLVASINVDCQKREVITRPEFKLPYIQSKASHQGCVTDTAYGSLENSTYLQRQGSSVYGRIVTSTGASALVIPIPHSSTGMVLSGGTYSGSYLWFIKDLDVSLTGSAIYNGEITHQLPAAYTSSLHDASGKLLAIQADTISFSANSDYMLVDAPGIGTLRVNTNTFEVLPFGAGVDYNIGVGLALRTAISPDGRYAAVASKTFGFFKLYDLSTCGSVPVILTGAVPCQSRDLLPFLRQNVPGFTSIFRMRFRGDFSLDVFANSVQNNIYATSAFSMLAAGQSATNYEYLAMGDSFASGEGAYQYKAITDTSTNKCHLSQRSYPYLISSALGYGQHESIACSGAIIDDIINTNEGYISKHSQAKGKSSADYDEMIYGNFLPGYRAQKDFTSKYQPSTITLSAGGNDIGFSDKIRRCVDTDTCYASYEDRLEIVREINAQFYRLTDLYGQIQSATDSRAKIYVVGYPQIAKPDGNCALNVHLNNDEIIFSRQLISYLNSVIKTAATQAGVFYVDVENALAGHQFCETDSWNVAVNGLTAGNDLANIPLIHGPLGNESYHPNALGHELLKAMILERTNNLTAAMPAANTSVNIPDTTDGLDILNAPKTGRTMRFIQHYSGLDGGVIQFGKTWTKTIPGIAPLIAGKSAVQVWLNSDPVALGTYTVKADGSIDVSATIPGTVPAGFHTLHIYGKNTTGVDIDLYTVVYVGGDDTDFDGDGVSNTANPCLIVPLSSTDSDKDNVDDACDAVIDKAPPTPAPVEPTPPPAVVPPIIPPVPSPPPIITPIVDTTPSPAPPPVVTPPVISTPPPAPRPPPPPSPIVPITIIEPPVLLPPPSPIPIPDTPVILPTPLPVIVSPPPLPSQPVQPPTSSEILAPTIAQTAKPKIPVASPPTATTNTTPMATLKPEPISQRIQSITPEPDVVAPQVAGVQTTLPISKISPVSATPQPAPTKDEKRFPVKIIATVSIISLLLLAYALQKRTKNTPLS